MAADVNPKKYNKKHNIINTKKSIPQSFPGSIQGTKKSIPKINSEENPKKKVNSISFGFARVARDGCKEGSSSQ